MRNALCDRILEILQNHMGKTNPISKSSLIMQSGGKNERVVRAYVQQLRLEGHPIISNSNGKGYYLATTSEEIKGFIKEHKHRGNEILKVAKMIESTYNSTYSPKKGSENGQLSF